MKQDWSPHQYEKFKEERSKPFWDLATLPRPESVKTILDLGCGTGELTAQLSRPFSTVKHVHGVDNSPAMLEKSKAFATKMVTFELADIETYSPSQKYDLVFSNAALHWVQNHAKFFPKLFKWLEPNGQIAVQLPYNFDHPSHKIAWEVAKEYPELSNATGASVLSPQDYSAILKEHFQEQKCFVEIYEHPLASGTAVAEWTKGTFLQTFQKHLTPEKFDEFFARYQTKLIAEIGKEPYLYSFKRILMWAQNPTQN